MTIAAATKVPISAAAYQAMVGQSLGLSRWIGVDQSRIDQFADVTDDHQFIHVDPIAAAKTPFGGTIAHGFLILSLLAPMFDDIMPVISDTIMGVNYGFDKVRFIAAVPNGRNIRGHFTLDQVERRGDGGLLSRISVSVEIEHETKPALAADWLTLFFCRHA